MKAHDERLAQVASPLDAEPMTRAELERRTGINQQRVSELLRELNAQVVGHQAPHGKGRPAPIYAVRADVHIRTNFAPLTTAWNWRAV